MIAASGAPGLRGPASVFQRKYSPFELPEREFPARLVPTQDHLLKGRPLVERMPENESNWLPWWIGLTVFCVLLVIGELLSLLYVRLLAGEMRAGLAQGLAWGSALVYDLAVIAGFAFLRERVSSTRLVATLSILAGAFVWFLTFSYVPSGLMVGPLRSDRLLFGAMRFFDRHAFTAAMLQFLFFCGFALLRAPARCRRGCAVVREHPWLVSAALLVLFLGAHFLTTERSPISLLSAMGITGREQPHWFALNRVDVGGFVLDGLVVLCWLGVYRSASRRWKTAIPWLACGGALLILAILPQVVSSPSFEFRRFFSLVKFWFGDSFTAAATLLTIGIFSIAFRSRPKRSSRSTARSALSSG